MDLIELPKQKRPLLNLGCGRHFHRDWVNLDLVSYDPDVIACDLTKGIPLSDNVADAVYHSHVLEHMSPHEASRFLAECLRVLKPGGVLRIAVPDLEQIARVYLQQLDQAAAGIAGAELRHRWMTLELVDQMVRHHSGGEMGRFMADCPESLRPFLAERMGGEVANATASGPKEQSQSKVSRLTARLSRRAARLRDRLVRQLLKLAYGRDAIRAWDEARFRQSGEIHRWMYDRQSLGELLQSLGFDQVQVCQATESSIERFADYELDHSGDRIRKPDSLFLEARRPPAVSALRHAA